MVSWSLWVVDCHQHVSELFRRFRLSVGSNRCTIEGMESCLLPAIDQLLEVDFGGLDDAALHERVVELQRVAPRLARDARCAPAAARAEVRRARKLRSMPLTLVAFEEGRLSVDHVDVLCAANHDPVTELFARDEARLVAEGEALAFDDFCRVVAHWRNIADDHAAEDRADRHHRDRYLKASKTLDGVLDLQARLGPSDGAIVAGELARLERTLFEQDWADARAIYGDASRAEDLARTAPQRHADAIVEMAKRSAAMPRRRPPSPHPAHRAGRLRDVQGSRLRARRRHRAHPRPGRRSAQRRRHGP